MKTLLQTASVIVVVVLMVALASAQSAWIPLNVPTTENLTAVCFMNPDTGFVVGANRTMLRTTDGGITWTLINAGTGGQLNAVFFADDSIGVATGFGGQILSTHTGGTSWDVIQDEYMVDYRAAQMLNDADGVVMGMNTVMQPFGTKTSNRWQNYSSFNFYVQHDNVGNEGAVYGIYFFNSNSGCAAVHIWDDHGAVVKTTDGGQSWMTKFWADNNIYAIKFASSTVGYACGANGLVAKSTDSGETWNAIDTHLTENLWALDCLNPDTAWAIGDNGLIIRTIDGGTSARQQPCDATATLRGIDMVNDSIGYVVGDGGVVFKTTTSGEIPNQAPGSFHRIAPADDSTYLYRRPAPVTFQWSKAHDPDSDLVIYRLSIEIIGQGGIAHFVEDTIVVDSLEGFWNIPFLEVHWTVYATDGLDTTVAENGDGQFRIIMPDAAEDHPAVAMTYSLSAYPNPFNPSTTLAFSLAHAGDVQLAVYDLQGREVWQQQWNHLAAGSHQVNFNGSQLPSGVYISRLNAGGIEKNIKLLLVK